MGTAAASLKGKRGLSSVLSCIFCCLTLFFIPACASQQPEENYKLTLMEKQIRELEDKMDESYHRLSVLQFMVDNHERTLKDMHGGSATLPERRMSRPQAKSPAAPPPATPNEAPAEESLATSHSTEAPPLPASGHDPQGSPNTLYNKALAEYQKNDFKSATEDFSRFLETYPQHQLADNALYWKGECLYAQKDFQGAINIFKQVIDQYPSGGKIPDALLKTGFAYLSINSKENARSYLKQVVQKYPFSPAGTKAEQMLKKIH